MSIVSRFEAIFQARANQLADQFDDPKASLDYSLTKLEQSRDQINRPRPSGSWRQGRVTHTTGESS